MILCLLLIFLVIFFIYLQSYHITLDCSDRYLVLPSCDVSEASSSEAFLQLPQTAALLLLLLQGDTIHALLVSADAQQTRDINADGSQTNKSC